MLSIQEEQLPTNMFGFVGDQQTSGNIPDDSDSNDFPQIMKDSSLKIHSYPTCKSVPRSIRTSKEILIQKNASSPLYAKPSSMLSAINKFLDFAKKCYQEKIFQSALESASKAWKYCLLSKSPISYKILYKCYTLLAKCETKLGNYSNAMQHWSNALRTSISNVHDVVKKNENLFEISTSMISLLIKLQEYEKAETISRDILLTFKEDLTKHISILLLQSKIFIEKKDLISAERITSDVLQLQMLPNANSKPIEVINTLKCLAWIRLSKEDFSEESISICHQILSLNRKLQQSSRSPSLDISTLYVTYADSYGFLANFYVLRGDSLLAKESRQVEIEWREKWRMEVNQGKMTSELIACKWHLASLLYICGSKGEAKAIRLQCIDDAMELYGHCHKKTLDYMTAHNRFY